MKCRTGRKRTEKENNMLRIGVIGCGAMGRSHIDRITNMTQGAEVIAVSDVFEEGARKAAEIAGNGCKVYTCGKGLISDPDVDAVVIASPGSAHKEDLLEAVKAGKRVFCEKPLCTTAGDCKAVMEAEAASGRHLIQVGFMRRYHKGYVQIKESIRTGEYGEPLIIHCTHRNPTVPESYITPMTVHDTAIHEIDLFHWMVNDDFDTVQVITPKQTGFIHKNCRDPHIMILKTKTGVTVDLEVFVNCLFGYDINCEVVCEKGALTMGKPMAPVIKTAGRESTSVTMECYDLFRDAYDEEIRNWVDLAPAGIIEGPNTWDGYLAAVTADALIRSQETGEIVKVESAEKPDFYE